MTLAELNALGEREFAARLGALFEHSPWVARRAARRRPFRSVEALHGALLDEVRAAKPEEQLALLRAHPELAGAHAQEGRLTAHSSSEQERLGFTRLAREELGALAELNRGYRERHGFPCIVALRLHASRASVLEEMRRRLDNATAVEMRNALEQVGHIARGRLAQILGEG